MIAFYGLVIGRQEGMMTTPTRTQKRPSVDSEQGMMMLLFVIVTLSVVAVFLVGG